MIPPREGAGAGASNQTEAGAPLDQEVEFAVR
jgi:hypothetical protein